MTAPFFSVRKLFPSSTKAGSLAFTPPPSTVMSSSVSLASEVLKPEVAKPNIFPLVKLAARFRVPPPVMVMLAFAGITSVSVTSMVPVTGIVRVPP